MKVSQKEVDYESLQADFEDLEEKLKKLSNSNQKQLTDFSKLEMKVEKIKAGAVSSAALASAMSQNNGSKIGGCFLQKFLGAQAKQHWVPLILLSFVGVLGGRRIGRRF